MMLGDARFVTARKERPCHWCGEAIEVGHQAWTWGWLDSGRVHTIRVHPECYDAWELHGWEECGAHEHERPERPSGTAQEGKETP